MHRNSLCSDIFSPIRYENSVAEINSDEDLSGTTSDALKGPSITLTKYTPEKTMGAETPKVGKRVDTFKSMKNDKELRKATRNINRNSPVDGSVSALAYSLNNYNSVFEKTSDNFQEMSNKECQGGSIKSKVTTRERDAKSKSAELPLQSNSNASSIEMKKKSKAMLSQYVTVRNGGRKTNIEKKPIPESLSRSSKSVDNSEKCLQTLSSNLPTLVEANIISGSVANGSTSISKVAPCSNKSIPHSHLNLDLCRTGTNQIKKVDYTLNDNSETKDINTVIQKVGVSDKENNVEKEVLPDAEGVNFSHVKVKSSCACGTESSSNLPAQIQSHLIEKMISDNISFEFDAIRQQLYLQHISASMVMNKNLDAMEKQNAGITEQFFQIIEELSHQNHELRKLIALQSEALKNKS